MKSLSRRDFIKWSAFGGASALVGGPIFSSSSKTRFLILSPELGINNHPTSLGLWWLDKGIIEHIVLPGAAHSVAGHPKNRELVFVFAQRPGTQSWLVDLRRRVVVKNIEASKDYYFYGHGTFTTDGKYLLSTENHLGDHTGRITLRRFSDMKILDHFPSYGFGPHDMQFLSDEKKILVANGGFDQGGYQAKTEDMNLSLIDLDTKKLIWSKKLLQKSNSESSIRHLSREVAGKILVGLNNEMTQSDAGSVALLDLRSGEFACLPLPVDPKINSALKSIALSVHINSKYGIGIATHPMTNFVSTWDLEKKIFLKGFEVQHPQGVCETTKDEATIVTQESGVVMEMEARRGIVSAARSPSPGLNSNHSMMWSLIA